MPIHAVSRIKAVRELESSTGSADGFVHYYMYSKF